jgi:nucleoside-diphosphate-sugar epimerase
VDAAAMAGTRVVHVSTMAVYAQPESGVFDETAPAAPAGDSYSDLKRAGERAALEAGARRNVHVTIVQPTVIYGPNAGVYGRDILEEMHSHRLVLVNGGTGICNAVYVDDVVTALLEAATRDIPPLQRFLISGAEYPTWQEFFAGFEEMLGSVRTVSLPEADALRLWRSTSRRPWLAADSVRLLREDRTIRRRILSTREGALVRRVARRVLPEDLRERWRSPSIGHRPSVELPIAVVRPWVVRMMAREARARIDKARAMLGYEPAVSLTEGMRITGDWARWAGLAPASLAS